MSKLEDVMSVNFKIRVETVYIVGTGCFLVDYNVDFVMMSCSLTKSDIFPFCIIRCKNLS